jgi:hypothetical protein
MLEGAKMLAENAIQAHMKMHKVDRKTAWLGSNSLLFCSAISKKPSTTPKKQL